MHKQIPIWIFVLESLQENIPVMLLYVLESKGSSPGRQGFFMAVNKNGEMEGSIGGGIMEHKFVEMAKERLRLGVGSKESGVRKQVHDKSAPKDQSGMICSGEQTIWLYQVSEIGKIENIISILQQNKNGKLNLSPAGIEFSETPAQKDFYFEMHAEEDWLYEEKIGYKNHLFIVGGGHCALAFSKLMAGMDFYIHLYDDRSALKTMMANDVAHEKMVVKDYSALNELISSGPDHYVVIMTFGYRTDDIALKALLGKDFKYIGLLGSRSKIDKMFAEYRKQGIDEKLLQRIHAPVGLAISSQTPEEIAVSIAAEIIRVKNQPV